MKISIVIVLIGLFSFSNIYSKGNETNFIQKTIDHQVHQVHEFYETKINPTDINNLGTLVYFMGLEDISWSSFKNKYQNKEDSLIIKIKNSKAIAFDNLNNFSLLLRHADIISNYDILESSIIDNLINDFWDEEIGLFYYSKSDISSIAQNNKKVIWSQANGHLFNSIAHLLVNAKEYSGYDKILHIYQRMALSIKNRQREDGFWCSNLADNFQYPMPESSGTANLLSGLAIGVSLNILDEEEYLYPIIKGWKALSNMVDECGAIGWVQPIDNKPAPSHPNGTNVMIAGPFLSAAAAINKLINEQIITDNKVEHLQFNRNNMLPAAALKSKNIVADDHPLFSELNNFKAVEIPDDFEPTKLVKGDYLQIIASQVKAMHQYQNEQGRIIDPVEKEEKYYTTPCYAHSIAVLAKAKYPISKGLVESGMRALDVAIQDMETAQAPGKHGDFFTWPMMLAFESFKGIASQRRYENWSNQLTHINPTEAYREYRQPLERNDEQGIYDFYKPSFANNWNLVNTAGEWARGQHVKVDPGYVDYCMTMQLVNFTPFGMYNEHGNALPYDLFARHYITGMLHLGYDSHLHTTYRDILWRGAWTSLFMQSPFGELPTGFRSSQHSWNEAEQAVLFEIYADAYAQVGRMKEAGVFKRAARLSLASIQQWIRPDGTGYIVKNRYPIDAKHGYENYSVHTCYNMLTTSMLAQAYQFANENIKEQPCPADIGGFAFEIPSFHKVFANHKGNYIEYDTQGDQKYNPTGLLRIHLKNSMPQLGPSDGCGLKYSGKGNVYAVGPEWKMANGNYNSLATVQDKQSSFTVLNIDEKSIRFELSHKIREGEDTIVINEKILLNSDGCKVENTVRGSKNTGLKVNLPLLSFDGGNKTELNVTKKDVTVSLDKKSINYRAVKPTNTKLVRPGSTFNHRNGRVEVFYFESKNNKLSYIISAN